MGIKGIDKQYHCDHCGSFLPKEPDEVEYWDGTFWNDTLDVFVPPADWLIWEACPKCGKPVEVCLPREDWNVELPDYQQKALDWLMEDENIQLYVRYFR
jgi:hypothetical protein